jgi:hypothetical protein
MDDYQRWSLLVTDEYNFFTMIIEAMKRIAELPDFEARGFGLGAEPIGRDTRDIEASSLSEVSAILAAGVPDQADLSEYVCLIYNQGGLPACVTYSIAGMQSLFAKIDRNVCLELDATGAYWENGGDGVHGVNIRTTLSWEQRVGMKVVNGTQRFRIGTYAYADPRIDFGVLSIKAAIAARRPCILAMLLPEDFFDGDSTGVVVTRGYHQVCIVGYTSQRVFYVNSFGDTFGNRGFGSVPWSYLRRPEQSQGQVWVFAYTAVDYLDEGLRTLFTPRFSPPVLPAVRRKTPFDR